MILAIDCGNTNIVFGLFDTAGQIQGRLRLETATATTHLRDSIGFRDLGVQGCMIASVVPEVTPHLVHFSEHDLECPAKIVGDTVLDLGLEIAIDRPQDVGADRLANAFWWAYSGEGEGKSAPKQPAILLDFGTATTFDIVLPSALDSDKRAIYAGGIIAPGVHRSLEALTSSAAKLTPIVIEGWEADMPVIGTSTKTAMQSGILWGYISLIDGLLTRIKSGYKDSMHVIATGGLAHLFAPHSDQIDRIEDDMTIKGLFHLYHHNQKKNA